MVVDADGHAWYSDFGSQFVGELDPKTGKVTDYPLPEFRKEQPKGTLDLELAPDGNLWVAMMYQAGLVQIDRKTKEITAYPYPKEWLSYNTQTSMVSPQYSNVDGKVWSNNQETRENYRLDVTTGKYENLGISKDPRGKQVSGYGMPTDHDNNVFMLEFGGTSIGRRNAKTGEVTIWLDADRRLAAAPRPLRRAEPAVVRRIRHRTASACSIRRPTRSPNGRCRPSGTLPMTWSRPRTAKVWTGSMHTDLVTRLDPKTGNMVEYLLPRSTNIRRVVRRGNRPAAGALGRQQPRRLDRAGRAAGLTSCRSSSASR